MNMDSTEHHQLLVRNSLSMALVLVHDACFIIFLETKNHHVETFLSISLLFPSFFAPASTLTAHTMPYR